MKTISATCPTEVYKFVQSELEVDPACPKAMVFDFDGVLAAITDDLIYKLSEVPG
jgi:hypothetical protein